MEEVKDIYEKSVMRKMKRKRLTKIIGTLTTQSNKPKLLEGLFNEGVDGMRIMLDYGKDQCKEMVSNIRAMSDKCGVLVPIIMEQRNKKRIMARVFNGPINAQKGTEIAIYAKDYLENAQKETNAVCINAISFLDLNIKPGCVVLFDMGKSSAIVNTVESNKLGCTFRCTGTIFDNSIVHILDGETNEAIELPFKKTIEEYAEDVKFALELDVEYILINGMDSTKGIIEIKNQLALNNSKIKLFAKIDNKWSVSEIDSYIELIDGAVLARAELGIKMRTECAFWVQKPIIHKCNMRAIPCIEASHFLDSVAEYPNPTCAETTDIYMAVIEGFDCLMFTKEILYGKYPLHAIRAMHDICCIAEEKFDYSAHYVDLVAKTKKPFDSLEAVSSSAVSTAFNMKSPVMIALTERGRGTRYLAKYKPYATVLALCQNLKVARQCGLQRSIFPLLCICTNLEDPIKRLIEEMKKEGVLVPEQNIVLYSGLKEEKTGTENTMKAILIE